MYKTRMRYTANPPLSASNSNFASSLSQGTTGGGRLATADFSGAAPAFFNEQSHAAAAAAAAPLADAAAEVVSAAAAPAEVASAAAPAEVASAAAAAAEVASAAAAAEGEVRNAGRGAGVPSGTAGFFSAGKIIFATGCKAASVSAAAFEAASAERVCRS